MISLTLGPQTLHPITTCGRLVAPARAVAFADAFAVETPAVFRYAAREASVAQLDRVLPSEGRGHRFESCRVHHFP